MIWLTNLPPHATRARLSLAQSFDVVIEVGFSEWVCCSRLICKTKLIPPLRLAGRFKTKKVVAKSVIVVRQLTDGRRLSCHYSICQGLTRYEKNNHVFTYDIATSSNIYLNYLFPFYP